MDVTLPSEVTSKTFIDTLPDHGRVRQSLKDPPLSFSQVCRQWRLVALSISDIWSAVASKLALPKFRTRALHNSLGTQPEMQPTIF
jgi:hypothetical protein